jgi:hypothetical protein
MTVQSHTKSPGLNGVASSSPAGDIQPGTNQEPTSFDEPEYTLWDLLRIRITGYWASFLLTGTMIPIVSSAIVVALYFSNDDLIRHFSPFMYLDLHSSWYLLLLAHVLTILLWLVAAWICYPFATAGSANPGSYGLLKARLCQLRAKLGIAGTDHDLRMLEKKCEDIEEAICKICEIHDKSPQKMDHDSNPAARITALTSYIDLRKMLYLHPTGLLWAFGSGYCNAWRLLHQAEEAIIAFDSKEEIIYEAMGDKMALQGSAIGARDELIETLIQAVMVLQPAAGIYLKDHQSNKESIILTALKEDAFDEFLLRHDILIQKDNNPTPDEPAARSALRRVRRAINSLRDRGWEALVRARNRLLASIAITGIVTHVLLCMTILNFGPLANTAPNPYLVAATAFYLVGAITGLFGRFYRESMAKSTVDDFGFSTTRFIATPLLSGLAGVGGVLLTVTLIKLGGSGLSSLNEPGLEQIFKLVPQFLLLAAIFGLTPNLLITGLQNTAKQYESEIQSSKIIEPGTAKNKA